MPTSFVAGGDDLGVLGPAIQALLERVANTLKVQVGLAVFEEFVELAPVGHPLRDKHPGKFRANIIPSVDEPKPISLPNSPGYPVPGASDYLAAVEGVTLDQAIYLTDAAAEGDSGEGYAWILERGRVFKGGRWWGSTQAPEGVMKVAIAAVWEARATVIQAAIAEVART